MAAAAAGIIFPENFSLASSVAELPHPNNHIYQLQFLQQPCVRGVSADSFAAGEQQFKWSINPSQRWIPRSSYFRIKVKIGGDADFRNNLTSVDDIALAESFCNNLYSNISLSMGGNEISSLNNGIPQIGAIRQRLSESKAWTDSIGASAFYTKEDFRLRQADICSDMLVPNKAVNTRFYDSFTTGAAAGTISYAAGVLTAAGGAGVAPDFLKEGISPGDVILLSFGGADSATSAQLSFVVKAVTSATELAVKPVADDQAAIPTAPAVAPALSKWSIQRQQVKLEASDGKMYMTILWRPPIGISACETFMPCAEYLFSLTPNQQYQTAVAQCNPATWALVDPVGGASVPAKYGVDYWFNVEEIYYYAAVCRSDTVISNKEFYLATDEMRMQSVTVNGAGGNYNLVVRPSSYAFTVAFQSPQAGSNTYVPPNLLSCPLDQNGLATSGYAPYKFHPELSLQTMQLTYCNRTLPQNNYTSYYDKDQNSMYQRMLDSICQSGNLPSEGGFETFQEWVERGPIFHYNFSKEMSDRSTSLQIVNTFDAAYQALMSGQRMVVVEHYRRISKIVIRSGVVVEVTMIDG